MMGGGGGFSGGGFREVLVDQPFAGKWMEVDMNLGGGHSTSTFQGTKFSDWAGGFSYKGHKFLSSKQGTHQKQHRSIYWRTLNDTLELTEISLHLNLLDNQVRYIFQGSPILGPITIQETENHIIILVATVSSANRFIFNHPFKYPSTADPSATNTTTSIFHQICNKPQMNFRSFNLYDHGINIPVPLGATCVYVEREKVFSKSKQLQKHANTVGGGGECLFAFSFDTGSTHLYKISRDDVLTMYDLRQANLFTRIIGITTSMLRAPTAILDAVIGLNFFLTKVESSRGGSGGRGVQLVTLSMNGQLNLWSCPDIDLNEWSSFHCGVVDNRFAVGNYTDSNMLLRKSSDQSPGEHPNFAIYIPGDGFRIYKVQKASAAVSSSTGSVTKFSLVYSCHLEFKNRELMDFCLTSEHLFTLVNNPEEETEWEIGAHSLGEVLEGSRSNPTFIPALLEPLPSPDVEPSPIYAEAKEFYMGLIFNSSSFTATTITKALTMFRKEEDETIEDKDWDSLRVTAMNMIDREIALETSDSEFEISDEDYTQLSLKYWLMFYNSCVEYHIHTVKPLGLFFEPNSGMVCVVKKSRISFLRPADFLETLYYFPHSLNLSDKIDPDEDDQRKQMFWVVKYLEVIQCLESIFNESHLSKIGKRLRENVAGLQEVCKEIAQFILSTDPHCFAPAERQLVQILGTKLEALGENAEGAMKRTLEFISSWETEGHEVGGDGGEYFNPSRLGAHVTHRILSQLMQHRFLLARDTMVLQYMLISFFAQNSEGDGVQLSVSWDDHDDAKRTTIAYFALLEIAENFIEPVPPFIRERGLKVANLLKLSTSESWCGVPGDELFEGSSVWPSKVLEGFCLSNLGSCSIRSRLTSSYSSCSALAHAQAAGRAIWTNGGIEEKSRPLEDFFVVACQYNILLKYAHFMVNYFAGQLPMKHFYLGLCHLCLFNEDLGLNHLESISFEEALGDEYFCARVLQLPQSAGAPISPFTSFYIRVLEYLSGVGRMAADGLKVAETEGEAIKMCSLAFKCALKLDDYNEAYKYILKMPSTKHGPQEKMASLRTFVGHVVREGALDTLLSLNMDELFNQSATVREQVESILFSQANLADPLAQDGVYQMLYAYHLSKDNYHKAAATMYYRAMRIGDKATGREALLGQKEAYLDVVTCLSLIHPKCCRHVIKKTGLVRTPMEHVHCFDPERADNPDDMFRVPCVPREKEMVVLDEDEIKKELQVLLMLCKLDDDKPVKPMDFERRAAKTVDQLALNHRYDDALNLVAHWGLDPTQVISYFTDVCCSLMYNILPEGGDPAHYFIYNDTTEIPSSDTGYTELAFRLLEKYLARVEKPAESGLHQMITLKLLAADVELPQWLLASYKKRNVRQLLHCLIRYGEWEKGTELSLKLLDAALGRVRAEEFDGTVKKISSYDPLEPAALPFNVINQLADQLQEHKHVNPSLQECYNALKERTSLYCDRVIECTKERSSMFPTDRK